MNIRQLVMRLRPQLRPYRGLVIFAATLSMATGMIGAPTPLLMRAIVDKGIGGGDARLIIGLVIGIICLGVLRQVLNYAAVLTSTRLQELTALDLQRKLVRQILHLPMSYHASHSVGASASIVTNDARRASGILPSVLVGSLTNVSRLLFGVAVLIHLSPKLAALTLIALPLGSLGFITFGRRARRLSVQQQQQTAEVFGHLYETIGAVDTVRALCIHRQALRSIFGSFRSLHTIQIRLLEANLSANGVSAVATSLVTASVLCVGAMDVVSGSMTLGTYFAFNAYAAYLVSPALALLSAYFNVQGSVGPVESVFRTLDEPREIDPGQPHDDQRLEGNIAFHSVSASYGNREAINCASFRVPAGARVGLVGRSGAGKSTVLRLISGFMFPKGGQVVIDGVETRQYHLETLRRNIAYVPQDVHIFTGTLRENIRLARRDATNLEIDALIQRLGMSDIVNRLDLKADTAVGVSGACLSGGERQLIGIGRAMLRDAPIVLLDESTAALDTHTDSLIANAIQQLCNGRTVIVIAHRLSTLRFVDRVLFMDSGRIAGFGSHESLYNSILSYRVICDEYLRLPGSSVAQQCSADSWSGRNFSVAAKA